VKLVGATGFEPVIPCPKGLGQWLTAHAHLPLCSNNEASCPSSYILCVE
jgi:hypothetical protein